MLGADDSFPLSKEDLPNYLHFDKAISLVQAKALVRNKKNIVHHNFLPFISYEKEKASFSGTKKNRAGKERRSSNLKFRTIRRASHSDAVIYKYYRYLLSPLYEKSLKEMELEENILAYRKIPVSLQNIEKGKCNIHFAMEAFHKINAYDECVVFALDIQSFFENIPHKKIKEIWQSLLGYNFLPEDHFAVFKSLIHYKYVEQIDLEIALGLLYHGVNNRDQDCWKKKPLSKLLQQERRYCDWQVYRKKICTGKLVKKNIDEQHKLKNRGIPQGAPISDLIANFTMLPFDKKMKEYSSEKGGIYYRYSDDILLILPTLKINTTNVVDFIKSTLSTEVGELKISDKKTSIVSYRRRNSFQEAFASTSTSSHPGISYLGFMYNGKSVSLKDGTVSSFYRRLTSAINNEAYLLARKYKEKSRNDLLKVFPREKIYKKFIRPKNLISNRNQKRKGCFFTYRKRAEEIGSKFFLNTEIDISIYAQLRSFHSILENKIEKALDKEIRRKAYLV